MSAGIQKIGYENTRPIIVKVLTRRKMLISRSPLRIDVIAEQKWGNMHMGETAIIIGNGISLETVPKELLNKYVSFGSNRIHMLPFQPTYFSSIDTTYLTTCAGEMYDIAASANIAFLSSRHRDDNIPDLQDLYSLDNVELVYGNTTTFPGEIWRNGGTVTYIALKIAFFMGFETILIVGCDHEKKYGHFYGEHYDKLPMWEYMETMRYHYFIAGEVYKNAGRRIINLSPPSTLDDIFERGRIEDWL